MKKGFTLVLDEEYERKLAGYYLYRSIEKGNNERPIIDGFYIQREETGQSPPRNIKITIEIR